MRIIICENESWYQAFIQKTIERYAIQHDSDLNIILNSPHPNQVLKQIETEPADCYFLDIELGANMSGMDLASKIREHDPLATIIFFSVHADKWILTFKYKLAALDFIVKDDETTTLQEQINDALHAALANYQKLHRTEQAKMIQIKIGESIKNIPYEDILYFETSTLDHKILLHTWNGFYEFYGKLKEYDHIDAHFFRCHKSYIVNLSHIEAINKDERIIQMKNGSTCIFSYRKHRELQKNYK